MSLKKLKLFKKYELFCCLFLCHSARSQFRSLPISRLQKFVTEVSFNKASLFSLETVFNNYFFLLFAQGLVVKVLFALKMMMAYFTYSTGLERMFLHSLRTSVVTVHYVYASE